MRFDEKYIFQNKRINLTIELEFIKMLNFEMSIPLIAFTLFMRWLKIIYFKIKNGELNMMKNNIVNFMVNRVMPLKVCLLEATF